VSKLVKNSMTYFMYGPILGPEGKLLDNQTMSYNELQVN